jgi:hypothetical protein
MEKDELIRIRTKYWDANFCPAGVQKGMVQKKSRVIKTKKGGGVVGGSKEAKKGLTRKGNFL